MRATEGNRGRTSEHKQHQQHRVRACYVDADSRRRRRTSGCNCAGPIRGDGGKAAEGGGGGRDRKSSSCTTKIKTSSIEQISNYRMVFVLTMAVLVAILHRNHLAGMFNFNNRFSRFTPLQRELTFRTEMGLYYSYFKTLVSAPTYIEGLQRLVADQVTEFPSQINTLKRFNLYPEVVLGAAYRSYLTLRSAWTTLLKPDRNSSEIAASTDDSFSSITKELLDPGPVIEPSVFYVQCVFLLNGFSVGVLFFFGTYLSGAIMGGLLTAVSFFYNHGECTRVQWTPPLRESFAYPFFVLQILAVNYALRTVRPRRIHCIVISVTSSCFMLAWQFAQFALLTQTMALFLAHCLNFIDSRHVIVIVSGQLIGLVISIVLLFGNEMLATSFLAAATVSVLATVMSDNILRRITSAGPAAFCRVLLMSTLTMILKNVTSRCLNITDDAHISDLLRSKLFGFNNFHTMLYTCAPEYDFMELGTLGRVTRTLLIPYTVAVLCAAIAMVARHKYCCSRSELPLTSSMTAHACRVNPVEKYVAHGNSKSIPLECIVHGNGCSGNTFANGDVKDKKLNPETVVKTAKSEQNKRESQNAYDTEIVYHCFQLAAFTVMAFGIMRLKLFWTPHMCLMISLLASRQVFGWIGSPTRHTALLVVVVATMSFQGIANVHQQLSGVRPETDSRPVEQLVHWINNHTKQNAVFAGPMPTMATIKLCTDRSIVNHPHYEDAQLRARTQLVYSIYSRKPAVEVWNNLRRLRVDYVLLERWWCLHWSRPGCSLPEIWDVEEEQARGLPSTCSKLFAQPEPYFRLVYRNSALDVLQVVGQPLAV